MSNYRILDWRAGMAYSADALIALYQNTFAESSTVDEGKTIATLVHQIIESDNNDWLCQIAIDGADEMVGAICWTKLSGIDQSAYLMSPVAVKTTHQNLKIGQQLILHGLATLKAQGVALVLSYGDPNYYQKVGFKVLDVDKITPPYPLSMPFGWIGQSLTQTPIENIHIDKPPVCVPAFCRAELW